MKLNIMGKDCTLEAAKNIRDIYNKAILEAENQKQKYDCKIHSGYSLIVQTTSTHLFIGVETKDSIGPSIAMDGDNLRHLIETLKNYLWPAPIGE